MTRLTRAEAAAATQHRIVRAASELFSARGYAATSVEDIAAHAGHTRSAVYKSVGTKEQVFLRVAEERGSAEQAEWHKRIDAARTDEEALFALAELVIGHRSADDRWALAVGEFLATIADSPAIVRDVLRTQHAADERGGELIHELCTKLGVEPPTEPKRLFVLVTALVNGLAARAALDPTFDIRATLTEALSLLLHPAFSSTCTYSAKRSQPVSG